MHEFGSKHGFKTKPIKIKRYENLRNSPRTHRINSDHVSF